MDITTKKIRQEVWITPDMLKKGYLKSLPSHVMKNILGGKSRTIFTSDGKEIHGFIKSVKDISIEDNYIDENSFSIVLDTICKVELFFPRVGEIYTAKISLIFSKGILCEVQDFMKLLIPITEDITIEQESFSYRNKVYEVGDSIRVKPLKIRFEGGEIQAVGSAI